MKKKKVRLKMQQINRDSITFAVGAIKRLNSRRLGVYSFDCWIDKAISQWHGFILENMGV